MNPESQTALEWLQKSIQTFDSIQMAADSRERMYRYNDALMTSLYSILEDQEADEQAKMQALNDTLAQYAAAMKELFPKIISNSVQKADADGRFDMIVEVEKFNPYHDEQGRFSTADRYDQFTITVRDPNKQHWADAAIAREKERDSKGLIPGPKIKPGTLPEDLPKNPPAAEPKAVHTAPSPTNTTTNLPGNVLKTCQQVEAKSVKLKNEKLTLIDEDGDVIHEKRGSRGSVSIDYATAYKMSESDGITLTHNHPGEFGGTFSGADVNILTKYNLRAIRAVGNEGSYSLERTSNGQKAASFNQDYGRLSNQTNRSLQNKHNDLKSKAMRGDISVAEANRQMQEYRTGLCNQMHDWLSQNSAKYGYNYVFTPSNGGVTKMFDIEKKEVEEETSGEIMLDGEFISGDNWMITLDSNE